MYWDRPKKKHTFLTHHYKTVGPEAVFPTPSHCASLSTQVVAGRFVVHSSPENTGENDGQAFKSSQQNRLEIAPVATPFPTNVKDLVKFWDEIQRSSFFLRP
jgi:hypothetical protein